MKVYPTRDALEAAAYQLTMRGTACHLEPGADTDRLVSGGVVVGYVEQVAA